MNRGRTMRWVLLCALVAGAVMTPPASAGGVSVRKNVTYGSAKVGAPSVRSAPLRLDLYRPSKKSKRRRPVVIIIHGGGFKQQSKSDPGAVRVSRALAARGVVAASIDYRLMPQKPRPAKRVAPLIKALPKSPFFTAASTAVDDTLTAVDYLRRKQRKLGIDADRLGLVGASAGAVTADHVAYVLDDHRIRRPKVRFVASLWGGILVPAPARRGRSVTAIQLERGEAALFAVHGDKDPTVPVQLSDQLVARARAQRVRNTYYRLRGARHGYRGSEFFSRKVKGSQTAFDRLLVFARDTLR